MIFFAFMSTVILEIGYGNHPAFREGLLFDNPNASYVGLELPTSFDGSFIWASDPRDFPNVTGSMDAMPFRDESFDYVLMRSVYGQFKSQPSIVSAVRMGIYECMRVLKPSGYMVISEENTPRDMEYISRELKSAGFLIKVAQNMSDKKWELTPEDDEYRQLRSPFYTRKPDGAYGSYFGTPNIVIGSKPQGIKLVEEKHDVMTNFYENRDGIDDWKVRELPFKVPVQER